MRYLFQLRTGLSALNYHKKRHNFVDTPSDICMCNTGVEDVSHYLFKCALFAQIRAALAGRVIQILLKYNLINLSTSPNLYLYGHKLISTDDNRNILIATINYVKDSKRFSTQNQNSE